MFKAFEIGTAKGEQGGSLFPNLSLKRRSLHSKTTVRYTEDTHLPNMEKQPSQTQQPARSVIATPLLTAVEGLTSAASNMTEHSYAAPSVGLTPTGGDATITVIPTEEDKDKDSETSSSDSSDSASSGSEEESNGKPTKSTAAEEVKTSPRLRAQPKKYSDDFVTLQTPKGTPPNKRTTPKRASTSKGRTKKEPLRQTEQKRRKSGGTTTSLSMKKRGRGCGLCPGCVRDDCGTCSFCLDKPKFGGPGKKKQRCALRTCSNFLSTRTGTRKSPHSATSEAASTADTPKAAPAAPTTTMTTTTTKAPITSKVVTSKVPPLIKDTPTSSVTTPLNPKPVPIVSGTTSSTVTPQAQVLTTIDLQAFIEKATKLTPLPMAPLLKNLPSIGTSPLLASSQSPATVKKVKSDVMPGSEKGPDASMKCLQCGRERKLSVARTADFCTQRCIIQWLDEHPDKTLKDAMGDDMPTPVTSITLTSGAKSSLLLQDKPQSMSRALKNLRIDMAPPGAKLAMQASDDSSSSGSEDPAVKNGPTLRAQTMAVKKATAKATPTAGSKRPSAAQQPGSVKKAAKSHFDGVTAKSVSFNLGATTPISSSEPPARAISIVPLERLSGPLGNALTATVTAKSKSDGTKVLPADIRSWTVEQVVQYFKTTADCRDYAEMFEEQEVDGTALLLLSHENLVKCLGIKLGRAVKIMAHVDILKSQFEKQS